MGPSWRAPVPSRAFRKAQARARDSQMDSGCTYGREVLGEIRIQKGAQWEEGGRWAQAPRQVGRGQGGSRHPWGLRDSLLTAL